MADFQPILARAIAGLTDKSSQARRSVYDRARAALVAQLRSLDPPLSEAEIMRERLSLDEAVSRVEADFDDVETTPAQAPVPAAISPAKLQPNQPDLQESPRQEPARPEPARPEPATQEPAWQEPDWQEPVFQEPAGPIRPRAAAAALPASTPQDEPAGVETGAIRPRVNPPRERRVKPGHVRTAIVGTGVAIAVAAIAGAAFYVNKIKAPDGTTRARVEPPPQQDNAGKIADRVGDVASGQAQQRGAQGNVPGPVSDITVAQRAILYAEVPEAPQQPRAVPGRVFWRLDSESAGQGRPVETIVRATIEVPDAGFALDFTIRRNADSAFPASHIIGMRFTRTGDATVDAIREVGVPQFKTDENERGAPLSAISSALGENLFVAALSNVPVEVDRNIELMQSRSWIDIPVRFASGRRGIVTFEKGAPGAQTLADALNRWR